MTTAKSLAATAKVDMLRAGIWKPRTKPGMFEGVGSLALSWLGEARKETGLPVMVEVASTKHIEDALANEVDVLWIGARTTVNPFLVQELANALIGVPIPVLIKNPINPDIELWSGAIERFQHAGLTVGMIHRGFSSYSSSEFRNPPMWHIPLEMKRRYPGMIMICDPSHICGSRVLLQKVAQTSIDLDFDGLMIEAHVDPDNAWSDARQQITPLRLSELLSSLTWRSGESMAQEFGELSKLREQINQVDEELLALLGHRMKVADEIGLFKKENNITIFQAVRWNEILEMALDRGPLLGLSEEFIRSYFDAIHLESIAHQTRVMNDQ
jgi:chorismate mutase